MGGSMGKSWVEMDCRDRTRGKRRWRWAIAVDPGLRDVWIRVIEMDLWIRAFAPQS